MPCTCRPSPSRPVRRSLWIAVAAIAATSSLARAENPSGPVSFRNEVMAVLSRAGCNAGACHGNQNGKGGFKLSLRGEDPDFDLLALTRGSLGRRVDPQHPDDSLVLLKASCNVPHEGGPRFRVGSAEYNLLRRWIGAGAPPDAPEAPTLRALDVSPREQVLVAPLDSVRLRVTAKFSDGSVRDVTRLAVFDPSDLLVHVGPDGVARRERDGESTVSVRYLDRQATARLAFIHDRPGFAWQAPVENNYIDRHVFAKLHALHIEPSPLAADGVFLRRVYLDTVGVLPTPAEVRRYLQDTRPDRRARLIDELLDQPEFSDFWALKWSDLLRSEEKVLDQKGVRVFHDWIRECFEEAMPLDEFARELIASRGSTYSNPAANYYRALRDPETRAEATAQVFLGIRLQCAKCHNHPFERWTQTDYHAFAAFFSRVQYRILSNDRRDRFDKHEFDGEQVVWMAREGEVRHPRSGQVLAPHFPGGETPPLGAGDDRLGALAEWVTRPDNPFFARAQANRIWQHLVGRGIVEPNDDFRDSNPPVNGPLLDALAADLITHHFDLRHLVRTILNSRVYQLSSVPNGSNVDDDANFSHALVRPLQAEQLFDAAARALGAPVKFSGQPAGTRAGQLPGVRAGKSRDVGRDRPGDGEQFLQTFGKPERALSCECERSDDTTLAQAFQLITGPLLNNMLTSSKNRISKMLAADTPPETMVEELYLASLSRYPTDRERAAAVALLMRSSNRRAAAEDLAWGLVNAKEFLLRH
jgi:Protein of unknown function (DUF1549)/Protein of unknown function (DUF1553)